MYKQANRKGSGELEQRNPGDRLLRVAEVVALLGYSRATIYRFVGQGHLPVVRVAGTIRFRYQSMLKWMAEHESPATEPNGANTQPTDCVRTIAG